MTDNPSASRKDSKNSELENSSCFGCLTILSIIALAIFGGISWFNANKERSESVQKARTLIAEVCSDGSLVDDISMIEKASQKLAEANKLLQPPKIPILEQEIPTLDSQTAQSELVKIPDCQKNLEKAKSDRLRIAADSKKLENLKRSFLSFSDSLDIRNGYQNYSDQLKVLKSDFESVSQILGIQENSALKSLKNALGSYEVALNAWKFCEEGKCSRTDLGKELFLPDSAKITTDLSDKYGVRIRLQPSLIPQQGIRLKDALQAVWQSAKQDIDAVK